MMRCQTSPALPARTGTAGILPASSQFDSEPAGSRRSQLNANGSSQSPSLSWPATAGHPGDSSRVSNGWPRFGNGNNNKSDTFPKGAGVIIPKSNLVHLMLRDEIVAAAREGRFSIWAVESVDEAIEVLTGMKAGARKKNGQFPRGTFNAKVANRLTWFARPRILRPIHLDGWWPW